jgi:Skp family chaperone for outer membrane proteins
MGGLVHIDQQALDIARNQQHDFLSGLRLGRNAAELELKGFTAEEEKLGFIKKKLQEDVSELAERAQDAYAQHELNMAMGLDMAHKNLRVEQSVRLRDLDQQAMALLESIQAAHKKLSEIEFNITLTEHCLRKIESQLRPVNSLDDTLHA